MSRLKARLQRVRPSAPQTAVLGQLRARLDAIMAREARQPRTVPLPPESAPCSLPGELHDTSLGPVRVVRYELEPEHHHGKQPVRSAVNLPSDVVSQWALMPEWAEVDPQRLLYIDTETTGLSRGTGTLAFLVGLGFFEDDCFVVEQLLLESPDDEAPILAWLGERVARCSGLVSYNGRSFDWPLLLSRHVMNRVAPPPDRPHLDLLPCARRAFRRRLETARLVAMEEEVLGFHRERDVDGAEIPGLYWNYVRHQDPRALLGVLEHNVNDIVALAALLGRLNTGYAILNPGDDPRDHLSFAKVAERARDADKVESFARAAASGGGGPEVTVSAWLMVAEVRKRARAWRDCLWALEEAVDAAGVQRHLAAPAHLALAKLHEHQLKDYERALLHAAWCDAIEGDEAAQRRRTRLQRRSERARREAEALKDKVDLAAATATA